MTQIEIWLRLAQVNELYGDEMVRIAHWLNTQPSISNAVLLQAGFSPRQARRFLTFSDLTLEKTLRWLEQPNHRHSSVRLRIILGCFLSQEIPHVFARSRWPLSAADSTPGMANAGGDCFVKSLQHVVLRSPAVWPGELMAWHTVLR